MVLRSAPVKRVIPVTRGTAALGVAMNPEEIEPQEVLGPHVVLGVSDVLWAHGLPRPLGVLGLR
jgi:hypothetical protein